MFIEISRDCADTGLYRKEYHHTVVKCLTTFKISSTRLFILWSFKMDFVKLIGTYRFDMRNEHGERFSDSQQPIHDAAENIKSKMS